MKLQPGRGTLEEAKFVNFVSSKFSIFYEKLIY